MALLTSSKKRGQAVSESLQNALKSSAASLTTGGAVRISQLKPDMLVPDERNGRRFDISLDDFKRLLQIDTESPLMFVDDSGDLQFPEVDDFPLLAENKKAQGFYSAVRSLAISLHNNNGVIQPVEVRVSGDSYVINSGHMRWFVVSLLGATTISAIVKEGLSALQLSVRRWDENDKQNKLTLVEKLTDLQQVIEAYRQTHDKNPKQKDVAQLLGISTSDVSEYMKVLQADLTSADLDYLYQHDLNDLRMIAAICRLDNLAQRREAFTLYATKGASVARHFVEKCQAKHAEAESKKAGRPLSKPTPQNMGRLYALIDKVDPDLLDGIDRSLPPKQLLSLVLERLTDE